MTGRFGQTGAAAPVVPVAVAFRLWAMAMVLAVVSACGQASGGTEDEQVAGPTVMSSRPMPGGDSPYRLRIRVEASSESGVAAENLLTQAEKELPARQLSDCWSPPAGEAASREAVVRLKVSMNRDGTVHRLEVLDMEKMVDSPSFRAFAESAVRAVVRCMPLKLPPDKYDQWRVLAMYFAVGSLLQR